MAEKKSENFSIRISDNFPVEKALRKFKRMCDAYGIVKNYRAREAYAKPSERAKLKSENAEKRRKKTANKSMSFAKKI